MWYVFVEEYYIWFQQVVVVWVIGYYECGEIGFQIGIVIGCDVGFQCILVWIGVQQLLLEIFVVVVVFVVYVVYLVQVVMQVDDIVVVGMLVQVVYVLGQQQLQFVVVFQCGQGLVGIVGLGQVEVWLVQQVVCLVVLVGICFVYECLVGYWWGVFLLVVGILVIGNV